MKKVKQMIIENLKKREMTSGMWYSVSGILLTDLRGKIKYE